MCPLDLAGLPLEIHQAVFDTIRSGKFAGQAWLEGLVAA